MERVSEMCSFHKSGGYIPKIIHLADIHGGEGVVCYDGNHRREFMNKCLAEGEEINCVIDIMFGATQNDVYTAFDNINKSVQVPLMYIEERNDSCLAEIIQLVKSYETKYKPFVSSSARYHAPHFNRDAFTDNLHTIYKSLNGRATVQELGDALEKLNSEYASQQYHLRYPPKVIEKCAKYGLWLFLERNIPLDHVVKFLYP
jgi:hypothetical protein